MESENFKERLIEFARKQYDMGQTNFEAFTGIAPGSINKIRSGISTSSLANIAERCPELSLRWLLLGEGEMLERGGGAHLSSHSHIPGASASSGSLPQHLGYGRPHVGVRGERVKPLLEARPYLVQPPVRRQVARHLPPGVPPRRPDAQAR